MICIFEDFIDDIFHELITYDETVKFINYREENNVSEYRKYFDSYKHLYIYTGGNGNVEKVLNDSIVEFPQDTKIVLFDTPPRNYAIYKKFRELCEYKKLSEFDDKSGDIIIMPLISAEYSLLMCMYELNLVRNVPSLLTLDISRFKRLYEDRLHNLEIITPKQALLDDSIRPPDNIEDLLSIFGVVFFKLDYFKNKSFEKRCKHALRYATTLCLQGDPHDFLSCPCIEDNLFKCKEMYGNVIPSIKVKKDCYQHSSPYIPTLDSKSWITYNQATVIANKIICMCNYVLMKDCKDKSSADAKMMETSYLIPYIKPLQKDKNIPLASARVALKEYFELYSEDFREFYKQEMQILKESLNQFNQEFNEYKEPKESDSFKTTDFFR